MADFDLTPLIQNTCALVGQWEHLAALQLAEALGGPVVQDGPFKGMLLDLNLNITGLPRKLIGSYEAELHHFVEAALNQRPQRVINIGAAEGYYTIGAARRLRESTVIAFETESRWRVALDKLAGINQLAGRIHLGGTCTITDLLGCVASGSLLIVDVEGAEVELLDPAIVPALRHCTILVETHEFAKPGSVAELRRRFEPTHVVQTMDAKPRRLMDFPLFRQVIPQRVWWSGIYAEMVLNEFRAVDQGWLFMSVRG